MELSLVCFWQWRKVFVFPVMVGQLLLAGLLLAGCITSPAPSSPSSAGASHYYVDLQTSAGPLKVFVREQGRGKPILFLHGFGASSYSWRYLQPELALTHRTIAIDLKGFGRSDKPADERYSLFDQADIVERFIEKKQLRDVTLVGHSYGGGVALGYAVNERGASLKRVSKLILLDSIAYRQNLPYFITALRTPVVSHLGLATQRKEWLSTESTADPWFAEQHERIRGPHSIQSRHPNGDSPGSRTRGRTEASAHPGHCRSVPAPKRR